MSKRVAIPTWTLLFLMVSTVVMAQRGGPPRRLEDPETIRLAGESRVEFHTVFSKALGREMPYSVYLPPSYDSSEKKFPVIYFLHGMNNDHTSWCVDRYGNLAAQLASLVTESKLPQFVMVHPNGESSFYTDSADGSQKFEQYIREDLIAAVEEGFKVRTDRNSRAIGGTSMGAYGALKIAMKEPGRFASVAAGSPIVLLGDNPLEEMQGSSRAMEYFSGVFGRIYGNPFDKEHWKANSLEELARSFEPDDLKLLLMYGTADRYNGLIPMEKGVRTLADILQERGADVRLEISEGEGHGWALIGNHLEEVVGFLAQTFE